MRDLKKSFFRKLDDWLKLFNTIKWKVEDERNEYEFIIGIVNKLMIIKIFEDLGLVQFRDLQKTWYFFNERDSSVRSKVVIEEFFSYLTNRFFKFSDIDFFTINETDYLLDEEDNWDNLYRIIKKLIGMEEIYFEKSIYSISFSSIDEDIFGHAYETILGIIRQEQGIYYTPKFVTSHISEKICNCIFNPLIEELKSLLDGNDNNKKIKRLLGKFIDVKILDPACGCGSFLVRLFDYIIHHYEKAIDLFENKIELTMANLKEKFRNHSGKEYWEEYSKQINPLRDFINFLGCSSEDLSINDNLYSKILVRHIYGVDLDNRALDIAKLNLWLTIIKKIPARFRFDRAPKDQNHILPNLSLNFRQGNSIIQLTQKFFRSSKHEIEFQEFIQRLNTIREEIKHNPFITEKINEIETELNTWRNKFMKESIENLNQYNSNIIQLLEKEQLINRFIDIVKNKDNLENLYQGDELIEKRKILRSCSSFLWKLDYANIKFDAIIGNPPYIDIKRLPDLVVEYIFKFFDFSFNRVNLFCAFSELGTTEFLLKKGGYYGFIVPNPICIKTSYKVFREFWIKHHWIYQVVRLPNNTFDNIILDKEVNVEPVILISQAIDFKNDIAKGNETEILVFYESNENFQDKLKLSAQNADFSYKIDQTQWLENTNLIIDWWNTTEIKDVLEQIEENTEKLGDICDRSLGITPYDKYKGHTQDQIIKRVFHFTVNTRINAKNPQRLLTGKSISRYQLEWPVNEYSWLEYGDWLGAPREWRFFSEPRILIRQIRTGTYFLRIFATFVKADFVNTQPIFNLLLKAVKENDYHLEYILSILNSYLMSWYYNWKFMDPGKQIHSKVLIENTVELPIKKIPLDNQPFFKNKVIQYLYVNNYIRIWKDLFDKKWQFLGGNRINSILTLKFHSKKFIEEKQQQNAWFQQFYINPPFDDLEYELPKSFNLDFEIEIKGNRKIGLVYIFNPEIGTKKFLEYETINNDIFELTIIGLYNYNIKRRSQYPQNVEKLLKKILIPVRRNIAKTHQVGSGSLIREVVADYNYFIQSEDSLEFCEILDHSDYCNHEKMYSDNTSPDLQLIQSKSYFSDLLILKKQIDAELEAHVLSVYGVNFNKIFSKIKISTIEKERIRRIYSNLFNF